MILTHPKKEKVNSWSMATLDKLSSEKTNFGSGWVLGSPPRKETESKSSKQSVMKNVKQCVVISSASPCPGEMPLKIMAPMNTSNPLLIP